MFFQVFATIFCFIIGVFCIHVLFRALKNRKRLKDLPKHIFISSVSIYVVIIALTGFITFYYGSDLLIEDNKMVEIGLVENIRITGTKSTSEMFDINGYELFNSNNFNVEEGKQYMVEFYKNSHIITNVERVRQGEKELIEKKNAENIKDERVKDEKE